MDFLEQHNISFTHEYESNTPVANQSIDFVFTDNQNKVPLEIKFRKNGEDNSNYAQYYYDDIDKVKGLINANPDMLQGYAVFITDDIRLKSRIQKDAHDIQSIRINNYHLIYKEIVVRL